MFGLFKRFQKLFLFHPVMEESHPAKEGHTADDIDPYHSYWSDLRRAQEGLEMPSGIESSDSWRARHNSDGDCSDKNAHNSYSRKSGCHHWGCYEHWGDPEDSMDELSEEMGGDGGAWGQ